MFIVLKFDAISSKTDYSKRRKFLKNIIIIRVLSTSLNFIYVSLNVLYYREVCGCVCFSRVQVIFPNIDTMSFNIDTNSIPSDYEAATATLFRSLACKINSIILTKTIRCPCLFGSAKITAKKLLLTVELTANWKRK